jgi:hypothetical protein
MRHFPFWSLESNEENSLLYIFMLQAWRTAGIRINSGAMSKLRTLSDIVPGLTRDILGKKGLLFGKMVLEWPHIAGPEMADKTMPIDLKSAKKAGGQSRAVLHLAVQNAFALEVSYQKALLIERLNMFFGYPAIQDIKLVQQMNVMDKRAASSTPRRLITAQEEKAIETLVAPIQENDLQSALKNLGKAILSRQTGS